MTESTECNSMCGKSWMSYPCVLDYGHKGQHHYHLGLIRGYCACGKPITENQIICDDCERLQV